MQFLGFKKWCSANYSDTKQKNICWEICKLGKVFGCVSRAYYFKCQVSWIELRKMNEVFRAKLFCKLSDLFVSFSWVLDFVLENLKLKKILVNVHWSVGTNIKKLYSRNNNIFNKRIPNMKLNHLWLWFKD